MKEKVFLVFFSSSFAISSMRFRFNGEEDLGLVGETGGRPLEEVDFMGETGGRPLEVEAGLDELSFSTKCFVNSLCIFIF